MINRKKLLHLWLYFSNDLSIWNCLRIILYLLFIQMFDLSTESSSISLRISPTVKEPRGASFSPVEDRLDDVNLTKINLILGKYNIQLVGIRKGSLILDFCLSKPIEGEIFIQAVAETLHELFQNVKDLLERFRAVELNLDALSFDPPKKSIKSKCFCFFPTMITIKS